MVADMEMNEEKILAKIQERKDGIIKLEKTKKEVFLLTPFNKNAALFSDAEISFDRAIFMLESELRILREKLCELRGE